MEITFLGHAGFCIETHRATIITDPWLSPGGAFDSAWFQFPRNHHLAPFVHEKLGDTKKQRYVYISHEHKDHFDLEFLRSLRTHDVCFIVANFRRDALRRQLQTLGTRVLAVDHEQEVRIPDGVIKLFVDDSGLNRDSAVLIRSDAVFLNFNDCKLYDAIPRIASREGKIDVFACQFSGATWHPTCYEYSREAYQAISRKKVQAKFEAVAKSIETLQPRFYVPSAGPACFIDPTLFHLNFEPVNIFPRAPHFAQYLKKRLPEGNCEIKQMMPGDTFDVATGSAVYSCRKRVDEANFDDYMQTYAADYEGLFAERRRRAASTSKAELVARLSAELERKLAAFKLHRAITVPLFFRIADFDTVLRIDFPDRTISQARTSSGPEYYAISAPSWELQRVLDGNLSWEDFSLTFRMRLTRQPDIYQTLIQGFLILEAEDLEWFCEQLLRTSSNRERIVVQANGKRFAVDRLCPHQGGDLKTGWVEDDRYLTCSRHGWQFDLLNGGKCVSNHTSVHAICLDDD